MVNQETSLPPLQIENRISDLIVINTSIDKANEVYIYIKEFRNDNEIATWINKDEAEQIIKHLQLVFNLWD